MSIQPLLNLLKKMFILVLHLKCFPQENTTQLSWQLYHLVNDNCIFGTLLYNIKDLYLVCSYTWKNLTLYTPWPTPYEDLCKLRCRPDKNSHYI